MSDNVLQTLQHVIQDVIAPDVRELKVRVSSIEKQMETQYTSLRDQMKSLRDEMDTQITTLREQTDTQFNAIRDQQDANFKALMAAIGESKARSELDTYKLIAALTERVVALESSRQ